MADENDVTEQGSKPTERVVLERVEVRLKREGTPLADDHQDFAWIEIGKATGTREQAVEAVAGDRKGQFRAPPARGWKGIVEQTEPDKPAVQRKLIDG